MSFYTQKFPYKSYTPAGFEPGSGVLVPEADSMSTALRSLG
jgi:hypothetical protein